MNSNFDYFDAESLTTGLKRKTIRGGTYTMASQIARGLISLAAIPVLARLLDPADFGLLAMTAVVVNLANVFVDGGFTAATIQNQRVTQQQSTNMFWLSGAMGIVVAVIVSGFAPILAWFYDEPRLLQITIALAVSFIFSGITIQHQALLRRAMQFGRLGAVQVLSVAIGQGVAITWAWLFRDYWALVALPIAMAVSRALLTWMLCPWRPGLFRRRSGIKRMVFFGSKITGSSVANCLSAQVEKLLLGRAAGAAILGIYDQAWRLLTLPLLQINAPLGAVAIPALSRVQERDASYHEAYMKVLTAVTVLTAPIIALALAAPDWVILTILGEKFRGSIPIFQILALGGATLPIINALGWLYISQGRVSELFRIQLSDLIGKVILVSVGVNWGALGVAWAVVLRYFLYSSIVSFLAGRKGPVSRADLWRAFAYMALFVAAGYVAAAISRPYFPDNLESWQALFLLAIPCFLSCLLAYACVRSVRELLSEIPHYLRLVAK